MSRAWLAAWATVHCGPAAAQAVGSPSALASETVSTAAEVRVTATPPGGDNSMGVGQSGRLLRGAELARRQAATLGETLSFQPGVQSSGFGNGVGRPVLRGLDGARVRIATDGLDAMDASSLSPDHAVAADPLGARSIEVLRGPAALRHGVAPVAGVVNVVSDRIPRLRLSGVHGEATVSADSASRGALGALGVRGGAGGWNWTAGGLRRDASDYTIAGAAVAGNPASAHGRLPNSFARSDSASVGGSYAGRQITAGLAYTRLHTDYGVPGGDSRIDLRQRRTEALLDIEQPLPGIESVQVRHADVRYRHDEIDGAGAVGTAFRSAGRDSRIELEHVPLAGIAGTLGVQVRDRTLSAAGTEAYVPTTRERSAGVYWVAQRAVGPVRLDVGARHDAARLTPAEGVALPARPLPARQYGLASASAGALVPLGAAGLAIGLQGSATQRAPAIEELYAGGPHGATGTFEIGDAALRRERATSLEMSLQRSGAALDWKLAVYVNRFRDYIFGRATDVNGDGVPDRVDDGGALANSAADPAAGAYRRIVYGQGRATFRGVEAELRWRPHDAPWQVRAFADAARGRLDDAGNVPRMAPARLGVSIDYARGAASGFVSLLAVRRQDRLATLETSTPGYRRLDAELAWTVPAGEDARAQLFVQGRNLLDAQIRLATSYLKDVAPQPGRSVLAGVRGRF